MRNYVATGIMLVVNAGFDLFFTAVLNMGAMGLGIATSLEQLGVSGRRGQLFPEARGDAEILDPNH